MAQALTEPGVSLHKAVVISNTPYDTEAVGKIDFRTIEMPSIGLPKEEPRSAKCVAINRNPTTYLGKHEPRF